MYNYKEGPQWRGLVGLVSDIIQNWTMAWSRVWGDRGQGTDGSLAWLQGEGLLASAWELWQPGYTV